MERFDQRLKTLEANNATVAAALSLPNEQLAAAWRILVGDDYRRGATVQYAIHDMLSILGGGTLPCVPFHRWDECIAYIKKHERFNERTCALCGSIDHDKESDHLLYAVKITQDKFDKQHFSPRLWSSEMSALQRGSNDLCSNRSKCRQRIVNRDMKL